MQYPVTADRFDGYYQVPCVKVRARQNDLGAPRESEQDGLDALWTVAQQRGADDWITWLLGDREAFDKLALASGGYLRDLLRMLRTLLLEANVTDVPVPEERHELVVQELRAGYLGFTNKEAAWLRQVGKTGALDFADGGMHHRVAVFLDTHVLLAYRNGEDWYGVHPVIAADVLRRAKDWDAAQSKEQASDDKKAPEG